MSQPNPYERIQVDVSSSSTTNPIITFSILSLFFPNPGFCHSYQ